MFSKLGLGAMAGLVVFVGYCVYFDRKRRADPKFKQRLKRKRFNERIQEMAKEYPDIDNTEQVSDYFNRQLELANEWHEKENMEKEVDCLCKAVYFVCQIEELKPLLNSLEEVLPSEMNQLVINRLPLVVEEITNIKAHNERLLRK